MSLPLTPVRFLYRAMDLYATRLAVVSGENRYSYRQFGALCERQSAGLLALGVKPGDRVAYLSHNTHLLLAGYFAPLLIHAICVPLNVRLTVPELREMVRRVQPRVLLFENDFAALGARLGEELARDCPYVLPIDAVSEGVFSRPDLSCFDELATAEVFFTSGSTAAPKMVGLSHRELYLHALAMNTVLEQTPVELHAVPLFHANGWGRPHTATMRGATNVLLRRFTPEAFFELVAREQATGTSLVPTMARMLLASAIPEGRSLKHIHIGGAPIPAGLLSELAAAFHCEVTAGYGLTEAGPVVAVSGDGIAYEPIAGVEVKTSPDGELLVRQSQGWFETGDTAVFDTESSFHLVDRKKDIIITGGENVASIEVETAIEAHPAVLECAVVAEPDPKWGEMPVAFVVVRPGFVLGTEELIIFLAERLARFKHPRRIEFAKGPLPRTGTGKLLKRKLRGYSLLPC